MCSRVEPSVGEEDEEEYGKEYGMNKDHGIVRKYPILRFSGS